VFGWWPSNTKDMGDIWDPYYANSTADEKSEEELQEAEEARQWEEEQRAFQEHLKKSREVIQSENDLNGLNVEEEANGVLEKSRFRQDEEANSVEESLGKAHNSTQSQEDIQPESELGGLKVEEEANAVVDKEANYVGKGLEDLISSRWPSRSKDSKQMMTSFGEKNKVLNLETEKENWQKQNDTSLEADRGILQNYGDEMPNENQPAEEQNSWEEEQRAYQEYQKTYQITQELYETQLKVDELTRYLKQKDDQITSLETKLEEVSEATDVLLEKIFKENKELKTTVNSLENWETMKVTWEIPYFERSLTERDVLLQSKEFMIGGYVMNLELSVMEKIRGEGESDRSVNFYFNHISGCNIMPIEMDGSTLTLLSIDKTQSLEYVGKGDDFSIESETCGIGWSRMTTLGDMCKRYLSVEGSVKIEALVRVRKLRNCKDDQRINNVTPNYSPHR